MFKKNKISPPNEYARMPQEIIYHRKMINWYPWQRTRNTLTLLLAVTIAEQNAAAEASPEKCVLTALVQSTIDNIKNHCSAGLHSIDSKTAEPELMQLIHLSSRRTEEEAERICNSEFRSASIKNVSNEVSGLVKLFGKIQRIE